MRIHQVRTIDSCLSCKTSRLLRIIDSIVAGNTINYHFDLSANERIFHSTGELSTSNSSFTQTKSVALRHGTPFYELPIYTKSRAIALARTQPCAPLRTFLFTLEFRLHENSQRNAPNIPDFTLL